MKVNKDKGTSVGFSENNCIECTYAEYNNIEDGSKVFLCMRCGKPKTINTVCKKQKTKIMKKSNLDGGTNVGFSKVMEYPTEVNQLVGYDFYILNLIENKSIAINVIEDNQYIGITFYKTNLGWSLNPTKMGKGYLSQMKDDLDYTNNFEKAKDHADQTK